MSLGQITGNEREKNKNSFETSSTIEIFKLYRCSTIAINFHGWEITILIQANEDTHPLSLLVVNHHTDDFVFANSLDYLVNFTTAGALVG